MQLYPEAPQPSPNWAKSQLTSLRECLPKGWEPWYVETPFDPGSGYAWCAKLEGAAIAACKGSLPAELIQAVAEFEADLPAYIEQTRLELEDTPKEPANAGRRHILESQLTALTRLHNHRHADKPRPQ